MRLPRMTTRRWMVAVAVVGLLLFLEHRRRSFVSIAAYHESKTVFIESFSSGSFREPVGSGSQPLEIQYFAPDGHVMTAEDLKVADWHEAMARKYRRAARYPWLPVERDPSPEAFPSVVSGDPLLRVSSPGTGRVAKRKR